MKTHLLFVLIVGSILVFLGEGFLGFCGAQEKVGQGTDLSIVTEEGPAGHQTIGIDESSVSEETGKEVLLRFSTLMSWEYNADDPGSPPDQVSRLDGCKVRITGFMYPLQEGNTIQYFCLLRTTQTCCYGPRPQFNQYIFVEMDEPTEFHRLEPVRCKGRFRVDPTPEEGFIFRMEGQSCENATR
jgi:hypothetical protein